MTVSSRSDRRHPDHRPDRLPDRRQVLQGALGGIAAAALPLPAVFGVSSAEAQTPPPNASFWRELGDLAGEADRLGYATPRFSATVSAADANDFGQVMRSTVDLIEQVEYSQPAASAQPIEVERLDRRMHALLRRVTQAERSPPTDREGDNSLKTVLSRPTFESLKGEYEKLFKDCTVRDKNRSELAWYVTKLSDKRYQDKWVAAAQAVCAPWYFIAIIHAMEASFDFQAHLHNGDPLSEKTVQVPKNRPPKWNPPTDWVSSATDALTYDGFADQQDWSLARILYRWESYNGFGSRRNGIHTPYLWSFSNQYSKGKFVADGVWDANAVSKQCGAATMLKALLDKGVISAPA